MEVIFVVEDWLAAIRSPCVACASMSRSAAYGLADERKEPCGGGILVHPQDSWFTEGVDSQVHDR